MKINLERRHALIKNCSESDDDFTRLYYIFKLTIRPDMAFREFRLYYYSKKLEFIDVTFLYHENLIVGFCAAAFYSSVISGKQSVIGRTAIGFLEAYQGEKLPKWMLYYKYIRYKFNHPFTNLLLTIYVANPLVYSVICKYTGIVYPRKTVQVHQRIMKIKEQVLNSSGLSGRETSPFAVKIHINMHKGEKLLQRINESRDTHVQFFKTKTGNEPKVTLLVIIPVSMLNIILTLFRFVFRMLIRLNRVIKSYMHTNLLKDKSKSAAIINLVKNDCKTAFNKAICDCKKTLLLLDVNCRKAFNLDVQYGKKTYTKIESKNRQRLRSLFTKR